MTFKSRDYLTSIVGARSQYPLKRPIFSSDVAVQTESLSIGVETHIPTIYETTHAKLDGIEDQESTLSASDLASILKWSKDISSDINLSSGKLYWGPTSGCY